MYFILEVVKPRPHDLQRALKKRDVLVYLEKECIVLYNDFMC